MLPEEFNTLSLDKRGEHTFVYGKYFEALDLYSKRNRVLYLVYGFIVEVTLNQETNKIEDIQAWLTKDISGLKQ